MGCLINAGVLKECAHNFGGLKELYLGNFADVEGVAYDTDGNITGVTMASGTTIFKFDFVKDTGQVLEELQKAGASSFINQTLNFQLNAITLAKKSVLSDLSLSTVFAIVKKADNSYWFYGEPKNSAGLEATVLSIDSGTAQADAAGATITLVGASLDYATTVDSDVVDSIYSVD
jgi:hypothetical protein